MWKTAIRDWWHWLVVQRPKSVLTVHLSQSLLLLFPFTAMDRLYLFAFLTIFCFYTGYQTFGQQLGGNVPTACIGCICEAASECNQTAGCVHNMCGLFRITWPYWADAGKPVIPLDDPNEPEAWVRCVTDPYCAATAVQNYLTRFEQDCNGDGKIDCRDYAAIHHVGGYACNSRNWDKKFEARFTDCINHVQILN